MEKERNSEIQHRHDRLCRETAFHCAQVLANVKASNIFISAEGGEADLAQILEGTGLECQALLRGQGKTVFLLYRRDRLEKVLSCQDVRDFFREFSYESFHLSYVLQRLAERYESYAFGRGGFPHEIGLVLEYPLCDVKGFIEHKGRDFLFSGYWKVYGNPEATKKTFTIYTAVRERVMAEIEKGRALWQIVSGFCSQAA